MRERYGYMVSNQLIFCANLPDCMLKCFPNPRLNCLQDSPGVEVGKLVPMAGCSNGEWPAGNGRPRPKLRTNPDQNLRQFRPIER